MARPDTQELLAQAVERITGLERELAENARMLATQTDLARDAEHERAEAQAALAQAQKRVAGMTGHRNFWRDKAGEWQNLVVEAEAKLAQAQRKGVLLYLHCQIDSHWRKWWVKTCEYWHEQADRARENAGMSAAHEGVWDVANELERRLGEALDAQAPSREVVDQVVKLAKPAFVYGHRMAGHPGENWAECGFVSCVEERAALAELKETQR